MPVRCPPAVRFPPEESIPPVDGHSGPLRHPIQLRASNKMTTHTDGLGQATGAQTGGRGSCRASLPHRERLGWSLALPKRRRSTKLPGLITACAAGRRHFVRVSWSCAGALPGHPSAFPDNRIGGAWCENNLTIRDCGVMHCSSEEEPVPRLRRPPPALRVLYIEPGHPIIVLQEASDYSFQCVAPEEFRPLPHVAPRI